MHRITRLRKKKRQLLSRHGYVECSYLPDLIGLSSVGVRMMLTGSIVGGSLFDGTLVGVRKANRPQSLRHKSRERGQSTLQNTFVRFSQHRVFEGFKLRQNTRYIVATAAGKTIYTKRWL